MELSWFLQKYSATKIQRSVSDDSFIDRLNHTYTSFVILFFAIILTTKQYVGDPIDCWGPAELKGSYEKYMESYCWLKNTYTMREDNQLSLDLRKMNEIKYYQWTPLILVMQAAVFYFPKILWRTLGPRISGINLYDIATVAHKSVQYNEAEYNQNDMRYMVKSFERMILTDSMRAKRVNLRQRFCKPAYISTSGSRLCYLYIFIKLVWICISIGQILAMNALLSNYKDMYGIKLLRSFLSEQTELQSSYFPKVTFCDFEIREIGYTHHYTVQCVLRANLLNEIAYTVIWFWITIVLVASIIDLISWLHFLTPWGTYSYLRKQIDLLLIYDVGDIDSLRSVQLLKFLKNNLTNDCIVCLNILEKSAGTFLILEIMLNLWKTINPLPVTSRRTLSQMPTKYPHKGVLHT
ncbi:hypothetical protein GJ496_008441 [Pomphorhynchus laevis]|nr:hypothetical protein GJ496_008441 [Pomphorhynchus laevis]